MHKAVGFVLLLFVLLSSFALAQDKTVIATGTGANEIQARNDALRNAVEQAVGVKIFSESMVKDFIAVKDVILSESFGLVTSYEVISKKTEKGMVEITVKAVVSKDVSANWAKVKVILQKKGNPKMAFCIRETMDGVDLPTPNAELQLMKEFRRLKFEVVDRQTIEEAKNIQKQIATLEGDINGIISAMKKTGADYLITGRVDGMFAECREPGCALIKHTHSSHSGDLEMIKHDYNCTTKIVRLSDAKVVGSLTKTISYQTNSVVRSRKVAAAAGFGVVISSEYIQPMMEDLLESWILEDMEQGKPKPTNMTIVIAGDIKSKTLKIIIDKLKQYSEIEVKDAGIKKVNKRYEIPIISTMDAQALVEILEDIPGVPLELEGSEGGRIELNYTP